MKAFLIPFVFFYACVTNAQTNNFSKVKAADTIIYYGLDFSNFILHNPQKVATEDAIDQYFSEWTTNFHAQNPKKEFELFLRKKVRTRLEDIQLDSYKDLKNYVRSENRELSKELIAATIKEYALTDHAGIGLVIMVDKFEKARDRAFLQFTFFDVETREVLAIFDTNGKGYAHGMMKHWLVGMDHCLFEFKTAYRKASKKKK